MDNAARPTQRIYTSVIGKPSENFEATYPPGMRSIFVLRGVFTNKAKKTAEALGLRCRFNKTYVTAYRQLDGRYFC